MNFTQLVTYLLTTGSFMLVITALAFLLCNFFTGWYVKHADRFNLKAVGGDRHLHKEAVPTSGGVAIFLALLICLFILYLWPQSLTSNMALDKSFFITFLISSTFLVSIGVIDDKYQLRARYKLILQILVSAFCWYMGIRFNSIFGVKLHDAASLPITIFWIIGFINAFNLIDGLDGLAAGLAIIASMTLGVILVLQHHFFCGAVIFSLGGACAGFLRYNQYPAKVFMGDSGSMLLGLMFSLTGLLTANKTISFSAILIPLLAGGVPLIDTFLAIWRRVTFKMLNNNINDTNIGVFDADKKHLHHRIMEVHGNQVRTAKIIYALGILFSIISVLVFFANNFFLAAIYVILVLCLITIIKRFAIYELKHSTELIYRGFSTPKKSVLVQKSQPLWDFVVLTFSATASYYLVTQKNTLNDQDFSIFIISSASCCLLSLIINKCYKIFWLRSASRDYIKLLNSLALGFLFSAGLSMILIKSISTGVLVQIYLLMFLISSWFIVFERIFIWYLRTELVRHCNSSDLNIDSIPVVIYGGGVNLASFLYHTHSSIDEEEVRIIGIVDDDESLKNHNVHGHKVIGILYDLEAIYKNNPFKRLVLTPKKVSDEKISYIEDFCQKNNIEIQIAKFETKLLKNIKVN